MRAAARAAALVAVIIAAHVPALGTVGSVITSFPARILVNGHKPMPTGMAYVGGYMWMMYFENVLAKRTYPDGSLVATYRMPEGAETGTYGLAYDGTYFWSSYQPHIGETDLYNIDPATLLKLTSYRVNSPYPIRHLAWDGTRFWTSMLEDQYKVHEMTNTGSVISTYGVPYKYPHGMVCIPDLPVGPRLVEGDWGSISTTFYVYKIPGRELNYTFGTQIPQPYANAGCWDGQYLWTFGNYDPGGNEYCYQIVAWEPSPGLAPASLGRIKAVYR